MVTAIIVDDEAHNRNVLKILLEKHCPSVRITGEAGDAEEAFGKIHSLKPQLVFLDVKMPGKSGFDLLRMFTGIDFEVIFVSAFNEFAIPAFDFNALGYILKPIDYSKLISVVERAIAKVIADINNDNIIHFVQSIERTTDLLSKIAVHHRGRVVFLDLAEVVTVESKSESCLICMADQAHYVSTKDLKLFEGMLGGMKNFVRISKSVIVNTNYIRSYTKGEPCIIEMKNGNTYEVSRRKKKEVKDRIALL